MQPKLRLASIYRLSRGSKSHPVRFLSFSSPAAPEAEDTRNLVASEIMVPTARQPAEPVHYTLYGVLYHRGESACGGHYSVDVLRPNGDGRGREAWLHIEDEAVSTVQHEDVFGWQGTERAADKRCAYLLFYRRTTPTRPRT